MNSEDAVKAEVRLSALETIVCQSVALLYRTMPCEIFDAVKQQADRGRAEAGFSGI